MSHAFDNVLEQRKRRHRRMAWLGHVFGRGFRWTAAFVVTSLIALLIIGLAEYHARPDATRALGFEWPWQWLPRLFGEGGRPIARLTGSVLVLYVGGWFTTLGIVVLRRLLSLNALTRTPAGGVVAVARGVVDEGVRNKVVLVLLGILLIALAVQPYLNLGTIDQPLRYRVQTFLSFSGLVSALLLGGVTILFSAHSVNSDLNQRRTADVFVKPLSRGAYLTGKFLGTASLMIVLVACWAVVTWGVSQLWLANHQALDAADRDELVNRVLVAREEVRPQPAVPFDIRARERLNEIAETNPERLMQRGAGELLNDLRLEEQVNFLSVPFGESRTYVFTGMRQAREQALALDDEIRGRADEIVDELAELGVTMRPEEVSLQTVLPYAEPLNLDLTPAILQLKFKVKGTSSFLATTQQLTLRANGVADQLRYLVDQVQIYDLPATILTEDGRLELEIAHGPLDPEIMANLPPNFRVNQGDLQFDPETWLNVYYRQGGFAGNVMRQAIVLWVRLAFLAMLGTVAAALLSYPVAATLSISIWLLAAGGSWLQSILATRIEGASIEAVDQTIENVMLPMVNAVASLFSRFSQLSGTTMLVDGRYITLSSVLGHTFWIGIVWTGLAFIIGWYFFNRREIARVQV